MKQNIAVLFGGRSCEHDVSVITGHQVLENADAGKYTIIPVYIARDGKWYTGDRLRDIAFLRAFDPAKVTQVILGPTAGDRGLYAAQPKGGLFSGALKPLFTLDAVIPALHGMHGEDGTVQGLLELMDVPYVGCSVLGSAVGMDKIVMRAFFRGMGFPVLPSVFFARARWEREPDAVLDEAEQALSYPVFVKPANLGSSIGISQAGDRDGLRRALTVAFQFDGRVLVEKAIRCREINCSALGGPGGVEVSVCEQPVSWQEFLTFEDKYLSGAKTKGMTSLSRIIPAPIDEALTRRIEELTGQIFTAMNCGGVARVDYMIDQDDGALYVNEINTIPGSFAFYLWEPKGVSFTALIDRLLTLAFAAHREKGRNTYAYETPLLDKFKGGGKLGPKAR